jgi:hypothetical protein
MIPTGQAVCRTTPVAVEDMMEQVWVNLGYIAGGVGFGLAMVAAVHRLRRN